MEIFVPVPTDADTPRFRVSSCTCHVAESAGIDTVCVLSCAVQSTAGYAKYVPEKSALVWTIKTFPVSHPLISLSLALLD